MNVVLPPVPILPLAPSARFKWVNHNGQRLRNVGILSDGTLHNPNGYDPDMLRAAVTKAVERNREREKGATFYRRIDHNGQRLNDVGILSDGTLHNPNGYDPDMLRAVVTNAVEQNRAYRSAAAKRAAETRRVRTAFRVKQIAKKFLTGKGVGPQKSCAICRRDLTDAESIGRGVGTECWQELLREIECLRLAGAK